MHRTEQHAPNPARLRLQWLERTHRTELSRRQRRDLYGRVVHRRWTLDPSSAKQMRHEKQS